MVLASSWLVTSWSTVTLTSVMSSSALTFLATEVVQVYRTFLVGSKVDQYHLKSLKKVNYLVISFLCAMTTQANTLCTIGDRVRIKNKTQKVQDCEGQKGKVKEKTLPQKLRLQLQILNVKTLF